MGEHGRARRVLAALLLLPGCGCEGDLVGRDGVTEVGRDGVREVGRDGETECPDGITCWADWPCDHYMSRDTFYPHCEYNTLFTPRDLTCREICGTPGCSGGGCTWDTQACPEGWVCEEPVGGPPGCRRDCRSVPTFEDGIGVSTPSLWVSADRGDDTTPDGTWERPFATIARALRNARAGHTVYIEPGTYLGDNWVENLAGTQRAPIRIRGSGYPTAERPIIGGGAEGLHLVAPRWVVIRDLVIRGAASAGIHIEAGGDATAPAEYVVLRNVAIQDIGSDGDQDCLRLSGLDRYHVLESEFVRCGAVGTEGAGIDMIGCHDGTILGNTFESAGGSAVQARGGSERITITRNVVTQGGARALQLGGATSPELFRPLGAGYEARELWAYSNILVGGEVAIAFVGCDDCLAANNTILHPAHGIASILQESAVSLIPWGGGRFINNLVVYSSTEVVGEVEVGPDTAPETFRFSHNLWYDEAAPGSAPELPVAEDGSLLANPYLADPAGGNYAPRRGSPAIGAGVPLDEVTSNADGECADDPPNIGAL